MLFHYSCDAEPCPKARAWPPAWPPAAVTAGSSEPWPPSRTHGRRSGLLPWCPRPGPPPLWTWARPPGRAQLPRNLNWRLTRLPVIHCGWTFMGKKKPTHGEYFFLEFLLILRIYDASKNLLGTERNKLNCLLQSSSARGWRTDSSHLTSGRRPMSHGRGIPVLGGSWSDGSVPWLSGVVFPAVRRDRLSVY